MSEWVSECRLQSLVKRCGFSLRCNLLDTHKHEILNEKEEKQEVKNELDPQISVAVKLLYN
jgi:hypothetical protein